MPRGGHACLTKLETAVCEEMGRQGLDHEHRSLRFRVRGSRGRASKYAPAIVARRGPILFLVEPVAGARRGGIGRLAGFLEQHSPELVLVVVAPDASLDAIPREAYDEIYPASEIPRAIARIREQDPDGIVLPFEKGRDRDTAK